MRRAGKIIFGMAVFALLMIFNNKDVSAQVRIHYIGLNASTDAILLEDNGHFGIVDSGEDWDYPWSDKLAYPFQVSGINRNSGFEQQVIYYLKSVGVTSSNLDFYIGTHAHSDHIGSADEIINEFHPKKLYLKKYDDSEISNTSHHWDNQYVYWNAIKAARDNGVEVIQDLEEGMEIRLGDHTKLTLYNTQVRSGVGDDNTNTIVVKVQSWNTTTLLGGDLSAYVARELIASGSLGKVDIEKMPHHGYVSNNAADLIMAFSPKTAIVTGAISNLETESKILLQSVNADVRSVISLGAATVNTFTAAGYSTEVTWVEPGWLKYGNYRYYMDDRGRMSKEGKKNIDGKDYYFDEKGRAVTFWSEEEKDDDETELQASRVE